MTDLTQPLLLRSLSGETTSRPPVWFMRQAGRYLAEYRALRSQAPDFVSFCLNPEMAAEATLQPMRRFPFDAAIVFADILLIPGALGQDVRFAAGEGPRLGELPPIEAMRERTGQAGEALKAVGETLSRVRAALEPERALIGFAGAPWTVATYMLDGQGLEDRATARRHAYERPELVDGLLEVLADATVDYLAMQAAAGAQVLKLFESWADGIPESEFERLVTGPHRRIVEGLRARGVTVPLIGFPRGASQFAERYAAEVPVQAVALDTAVPLEIGRRIQAGGKAIQGALDPLLLRVGGPRLDERIDQLKAAWSDGPWIFNLGHGILPDVPVERVEQVLRRIGAYD
ncbi:MAG TPA: uroporphyrinogen decarboxylase [Caulobacteraceae bacterium]|nr:uroporphyrinogen decarboxylase [Caulobacteraceae bacterium]